MNRLTKYNIGYILLLIGSWLAVLLIMRYWGFLYFKLSILSIGGDHSVSLVAFLPACCCVVFGYVFAVLLAGRKNKPERGGPETVVDWKAFIWFVPGLAFALWLPLYLVVPTIPFQPPYSDGSYFPDFEIVCGVIAGIAMGSIRKTQLAGEGGKRAMPLVALKAFVSPAIYFVLFCLSCICIQQSFIKFYGLADYGAGAYWITAGNMVFFGALLGLLFRLPQLPQGGKWACRSNNTFIWVIIFFILIVSMGLAWEAFTQAQVPSFPSPRGRVPDLAVIWMFALGYLAGNSIERKGKAGTAG